MCLVPIPPRQEETATQLTRPYGSLLYSRDGLVRGVRIMVGTAYYMETGKTLAETVLDESGIDKADWAVVRRYAEHLAACSRGLRPSAAMDRAVSHYEDVGRDTMGDPLTPQVQRTKGGLPPSGWHATTTPTEGPEHDGVTPS